MLVLCFGMIRSGSTWSYNLARDLMRAAGHDPIVGGYSESFVDWLETVPQDAPAIIKCHLVDDATIKAILASGRPVAALFTFRDAGPAIAS